MAKHNICADDDVGNDIKEMLTDYKIRHIFGTENKEQPAFHALQTIIQRNSAADYAASTKLDWTDEALMALFQNGLRDTVKDQLAF